MAEIKAAGYHKQATSSQANQPVFTRHEWDCTVQAAADKVLIARLAAGHRLDIANCEILANGLQDAVNFDVCVAGDTNLLFDNVAVLATTFSRAVATAYELGETIGVDYNAHRDIYLLINSGAATAPVGGKVTLKLVQYPVPQ